MLESKILSNMESMKYFDGSLEEEKLIDIMSDLKHRIFPRPFERLSNIKGKSSLVGVEIGVCGGEHALSLLNNLKLKKLYCIDPYDLYENYDEGIRHYGKNQLNLTETEKRARDTLFSYKDNVVWIKKKSDDAIDQIEELVDFVYIDGNHNYDFVRRDIENYYPLIKNGGVIGGHDFTTDFRRSTTVSSQRSRSGPSRITSISRWKCRIGGSICDVPAEIGAGLAIV